MNEYFVDKRWKFAGKDYLESKCVSIELSETSKRQIASKRYLTVVKNYKVTLYSWSYLLDFHKDYLLALRKNTMLFVFLHIQRIVYKVLHSVLFSISIGQISHFRR